MSRSGQFNSAIQAMKNIGIPSNTTKSVLKSLLKIYDNKWDLIKEENYRTLADAIFECQETQDKEKKNINGNVLKMEEDYSEYQRSPQLRTEELPNSPHSVPLLPYHDTPSSSRKSIVEVSSSPLKRRRKLKLEDNSGLPPAACLPYELPSSSKQPIFEMGSASSGAVEKSMYEDEAFNLSSVKKPKVEVAEIDKFPISSIHDLVLPSINYPSSYSNRLTPRTSETEHFGDDSCEVGVDIPLSILHPSRLEKPDKGCHGNEPMHFPNKEKNGEHGSRNKNVVSDANGSRPHDVQTSLRMTDSHVRKHIVSDCSESLRNGTKVNREMPKNINCRKEETEALAFERNTQIVLFNHDLLAAKKPVHDVDDISKGEENVRVPIVNEVDKEPYPPPFHYIPKNIVYQNAYVNFSLGRLGDEDFCASCFGNCLLESTPCACASQTGGEYAYTIEGLLKKEFLDEAISLNREPEKHKMLYCKDCPLERLMTEEPCKGHLVRKFIKECWSKCGCSKQCGNRVVQRGITMNLQVFSTREGKGWGLRTLERLPRGAFVCEYVGEIVTNTELFYRNEQHTSDEKHTYRVLLDADWGSKGILKDEEALCLDATYYGNVARFINHRCFDATLVEIPVEIETPDRHYYHLSFFTTRAMEPYEELTWDYGLDFENSEHPSKCFECRCGSQVCRDPKHHTGVKQQQIVLSGR